MASVTQRAHQIKQPYGGYLRPRDFEKEDFSDNEILKEENIDSGLVGMAVDYLTRFMIGKPVLEAFDISLRGAHSINELEKAFGLLHNVRGLDDSSIYNACKLVGYDVCYRKGPLYYKNVDEIEADADTINNIRIMVNRSLSFFEKYGPITKDGFTFPGAYTRTIHSGDGDFMTSDTMWDFKVSKRDITSEHTLQLLIYYIMGIHSTDEDFKNIKKLGFFNPRKNRVYIRDIASIPQEVIDEVSTTVIGYSDSNEKVSANTSDGKKEPEEKAKNEVEDGVKVSTIRSSYYNSLPEKKPLEPQKRNDLMTLPEIMNALSCSRYMVMKYYTEQGLPMFKENNKYYIRKAALFDWIEKKKKEEEARIRSTVIFTIVIIIVLIIFLSRFLRF